jgi:hypothetical protein
MRVAVFASAVIIAGLLSISLAPALVQRASASIGSADAAGLLYTGVYFESDFAFTYTASDCIEATLSLNGVLQSNHTAGCYSSGTYYGYLLAAPAAGTYTLNLVSTSSGLVEFTKSWTTPGFAMTVTASASTASVGDMVGINALFTLTPNGPDYLSDAGVLGVSANSTLLEDVYFTVASAHYLSYYAITPNPVYETAALMIPVSFGTAGTKTIGVAYLDPFTAATGSVSVAVSDPSSAQTRNLRSELNSTRADLNATKAAAASASDAASSAMALVYVALAFGVVGTALGAAGFLSARRARRSLPAATPPAQPPQAPPPAQPPQAPPPLQPPPTPPPTAPPPSGPLPPSP